MRGGRSRCVECDIPSLTFCIGVEGLRVVRRHSNVRISGLRQARLPVGLGLQRRHLALEVLPDQQAAVHDLLARLHARAAGMVYI